MLLPRVIPCLLLKGCHLVKTVGFRTPVYLGDPRNAVRIYNEREVDELVLLDIDATPQGKPPDFDLIQEIVSEAFMPVAVGGGITNLEQARRLFALGAEKVVVCSAAMERPEFIRELADAFGSQSVVVCLDVTRTRSDQAEVWVRSAHRRVDLTPVAAVQLSETMGAGEIIVNSIERDGTMAGYDLGVIRQIATSVSVPVVALGGAGSIADLGSAIRDGGAAAVAAGSLFVFHGRLRGVLINFPDRDVLVRLLSEAKAAVV
jgi:cyclase